MALSDGDFGVVIPLPLDGRLGGAISAARQRDVGAFADDHVARAQRVVYGRRHCKQHGKYSTTKCFNSTLCLKIVE